MNTKNCQILKNCPFSKCMTIFLDTEGVSSQLGWYFFCFVERDANIFQIEVINKKKHDKFNDP